MGNYDEKNEQWEKHVKQMVFHHFEHGTTRVQQTMNETRRHRRKF